jgi:hypothetical protein
LLATQASESNLGIETARRTDLPSRYGRAAADRRRDMRALAVLRLGGALAPGSGSCRAGKSHRSCQGGAMDVGPIGHHPQVARGHLAVQEVPLRRDRSIPPRSGGRDLHGAKDPLIDRRPQLTGLDRPAHRRPGATPVRLAATPWRIRAFCPRDHRLPADCLAARRRSNSTTRLGAIRAAGFRVVTSRSTRPKASPYSWCTRRKGSFRPPRSPPSASPAARTNGVGECPSGRRLRRIHS